MEGITDTVLMIRPHAFGSNQETLTDNAFQSDSAEGQANHIKEQALIEFDAMVEELQKNDIKVIVVEDNPEAHTPDAVFPNNWFSTHATSIVTYPMRAASRRLERREDIVDLLMKERGYKKRYSFEYMEEEELYLEGTGSMVLDRKSKVLYACLSQRTDIKVLEKFAVLQGYQKIVFTAVDEDGKRIYHTNVLMAIATDYVVICLAAIPDEAERREVIASFEKTNKEIIDISMAQMNAYAGNMLQVKSKLGEKFMIMSKSAYESMSAAQIDQIRIHNKILTPGIPTIEKYGGGSVRCMIAEIF